MTQKPLTWQIFWSSCGRLRWLYGINTALEEYQRRQTEYVSDPSGVAVVADDHSLFGCGDTMEEPCKATTITIYTGYWKESGRLGCGSI